MSVPNLPNISRGQAYFKGQQSTGVPITASGATEPPPAPGSRQIPSSILGNTFTMISPTHGRLELVRASDFARIANEFDQARAERDQARSIAVKLEAELGVKDALLQRVLDERAPFTMPTVREANLLTADITAALEVEA